MLFLSFVLAIFQVGFFASAAPTKGTWTHVDWPNNNDCFVLNPLLMTDGSVLIFESCYDKNGTVYTLSPDINGKYETGILKGPLASLPNNWSPGAFASAVLANSKVIIAGGEHNYVGDGHSNVAILDLLTNKWTSIPPPDFKGSAISDAQSVVLPDGSWLLASPYSRIGARLDPSTLTWKTLKFTGKVGYNNEEGWTLLPDGTVLTVDCYTGAPYDGMNRTEIYDPATDTWTSAGASPVYLSGIGEIGGQVLRPDGTVFIGGSQGNVAFYDTRAKSWRKGPRLPKSPLGYRCTMQDAAAAILPNGNIFVSCSGGKDNSHPDATGFQGSPTFWFELEGDKWYLQPNTINNEQIAFSTNMLVLPTGQILQTGYSSKLDIFTPGASSMVFQDAWRPVITSQLTSVSAGSINNFIEGVLFNGMSQGAAFGDDCQSNSNYPLIRITNKATKHVFYCRTFDHSSMGVALTDTPVSTKFDVPKNIELGPSTLEVVAAGIPSLPLSIEVTAFNPNAPTFLPTRTPTRSPTVSPLENGIFFCNPAVSFSGSEYKRYPAIFETLSSSLTISMWITTKSVSAYLVSIGRSADNYLNEFMLNIDSNGYLNFVDFCGFYGVNSSTFVKVNTGVKTHIAFVMSETKGIYYVNGVVAGFVKGRENCEYLKTDLIFGADMRDSTSYFKGSMSGVAMYSSALNPKQIASIYKSSFVNPTGNSLVCPQQAVPSRSPSKIPTSVPSKVSTTVPSKVLSSVPTTTPTKTPTSLPSKLPTVVPTKTSSLIPTSGSTSIPSAPSTTSNFGSMVFFCQPTVQFSGLTYKNYPTIPEVISSSLSISMWITTKSFSADLITLGRSVSNDENELLFSIDSKGYLNFEDYCSGYGFNGVSSKVKVNTGVNTHVAFVKSGTKGTYYVNGVAAGVVTASRNCQYKKTDLVFGADKRYSNYYFKGEMSRVIVFSSVLSSTQIASIYNGAPVSPTGNSLVCPA